MLIVQEQLRAVGLNMNLKIGRSHRLSCRQPQRQEHAGDAFVELSADPDAALSPAAVVEAEVKADGKGGGNYSHYGVAIPGIDDLLAKALDGHGLQQRMCDTCRRSSCRCCATCR